jgi:hypothetical protein
VREATFAIYSRCRLHGHRGPSNPGCREFARLYAVARHYSDSSGGKVAVEDFCATAVGSAVEQGPMQEVDACVAGAEEVLSSSEVSEAAERASDGLIPKLLRLRQPVVSMWPLCRRHFVGCLLGTSSTRSLSVVNL